MKTKIITLESHDDLISVRDKLSWAKTPRILLVWPKYEKVTLRLLDLKVLQRHADALGAQLGLVTRRLNVKRDAEALGLPVFKSTTAAQKEQWVAPAPKTQRIPKPPRRDLRSLRDEVYVKEPAWQVSLIGRVVTFSVGVLAVLTLAALFAPRAAVTLYPESQTVSMLIPVRTSTTIPSVSLTGDLPSKAVTLTVNAAQTMPVTSRISISEGTSTGVAQFKNLGQDEILIPAGTLLATETLVRFITLNDVRLSAGIDQVVEVRIEALEAGAQGNVEAGAISVIEGPLGLSVTVSNLEPTIGGTDRQAIGAGVEDRAVFREKVLTDLRSAAEAQIRLQLGEEDLLLMDTVEIVEIAREDYAPPPGKAGNTLTLMMQVEYKARYILAEDLRQLAASSVSASIPAGFSAFGEMTFEPVKEPVTDSSGFTHFQLEVSQTALRTVDVMQVFNLIRGHDAQTAKEELQAILPMRQAAQISMKPAWWTWLPLIPFNISVEIK